ncbi:hypothetical protein L63ED372_00108 [Limnohabitans sp. 63ED37-2]|nr:hypothetical protein L63ED372_00108 [Limnohabitans sp. 63ED37-2]
MRDQSLYMPKLLSALASGALASASLGVQAQQISPSGYTGAINTPTAFTLKPASMGMSLTNSIPEFYEQFPGVGSMLSLNLGFGLAPGLEAVGRLTNNGDLHCDLYYSSCKSSTRDLSVGGKYQLPLHWLFGNDLLNHQYFKPALAFGITDYGGAATLYRQKYAVGSVTSGPVTLSAGRAASIYTDHGGGLIQGNFGSVIYQLTPQLSAIAETDSRERRLGVSWTHRLTGNTDLVLAASKKLTNSTYQQASQATLALVYHFGRGDKESAAKPVDTRDWGRPTAAAIHSQEAASPSSAPKAVVKTESAEPVIQAPKEALASPAATVKWPEASDQDKAQALADRFAQNGFSDIDVAQTPSGWLVRAEPRLWRQNRLDAYGAALSSYLLAAQDIDLSQVQHLNVALTFMGQVVGGLSVEDAASAIQCMRQYLGGADMCSGGKAFKLHYEQETLPEFKQAQWLLLQEKNRRFMPQFELSPAASYTAGTEFGLFDYSIGATLGWEVPLAKGLFWQGFYAQLLTESDEFKDPTSYFRRVGMGEATRAGSNLLVYQTRLLPQWSSRLWGQLSVGDLGYQTSGHQINAYWATEDGRYRATWVKGQWRNESMWQVRNPHILNLSVRPLSSDFQITYSTGQFHNNDKGHRLGLSFSFADNGVQFFWRKTGPSNILPNNNAFMGFSITMPLGPKQALEAGPASFRLRDRWEMGVETKVGQKDNYIEPFYGAFPGIRHSLDTDVFDFNRNDIPLAELNSYRIRVTAREVYLANTKR